MKKYQFKNAKKYIHSNQHFQKLVIIEFLMIIGVQNHLPLSFGKALFVT